MYDFEKYSRDKLPNYYHILGLQQDATSDDIKNAYKVMAMNFHPDKNKSKYALKHMQLINEAYDALKNNDSKHVYDGLLNMNHIHHKETNSKTTNFSINSRHAFEMYDEILSIILKAINELTIRNKGSVRHHNLKTNIYQLRNILKRNANFILSQNELIWIEDTFSAISSDKEIISILRDKVDDADDIIFFIKGCIEQFIEKMNHETSYKRNAKRFDKKITLRKF
jgi:hypothetical protein